MIDFQTGDVLLLPKEEAPGLYTIAEKFFGKDVADFLAKIEHHRYIHAELYLGNGYSIAALFNRVHLVSYPLKAFDRFDVYRYNLSDYQKLKMRDVALEYFNKPYDFASLILNGLPEILSLGMEPIERLIENYLNYDNPNAMICSELVARVYEKVGVKIEPRAEFVTPDDISQTFKKIL
jgi:uncharacterized protein YycO